MIFKNHFRISNIKLKITTQNVKKFKVKWFKSQNNWYHQKEDAYNYLGQTNKCILNK